MFQLVPIKFLSHYYVRKNHHVLKKTRQIGKLCVSKLMKLLKEILAELENISA